MNPNFKEEFLSLRNKIIDKEFKLMNDRQKEAVFCVNGPLLILAGAGSGKTTVLVNRIYNIIKYGQAYDSKHVPDWADENDINLMKAFYDGAPTEYEDIKGLLSENPAKPWQILAITFTNKAAGELKERLQKMLGPQGDEIWASTFHSACARILRRDSELLGYSSRFAVYDTDDSKRAMKECQRLLKIDEKNLSHRAILHEISRAKDSLKSPEEYLKDAGDDYRKQKIAEAYKLYQKTLKESDAMDFDDLLYNTVKLLEKEPEILERYQNRFKYIMVDEYQDTNHAQYVFVNLLADKHRNLCVVGDDDQSIYKFRGATVENILGFENDYPEAKIIRLERNYRSTQHILNAANSVIKNNERRKGKNLWTENDEGDKIHFFTADDERAEANYIADEIMNSVNEGKKWSEHAILYRTNAQSNVLESVFIRSAIPYKIIGGYRFYERKEIKDAISYLSVIHNTSDNIRLRRIINEPKRGIGETSISHVYDISAQLGVPAFEIIKTADQYASLSRAALKLKGFANIIEELVELSEEKTIHETFELMLHKTGYLRALQADKEKGESRIENLNELSSNLIAYENENEDAELGGFLEEVSLMTDLDNYDESDDRTVMMTLHSAKGLEFPVVFISGMEEGIFPGNQSMYDPEELEEERRLAYVGITRAKEKLYIMNASRRMLYGSTSHNSISRFALEIPDEITQGKVVRKAANLNAMLGASDRESYLRSFREKRAQDTLAQKSEVASSGKYSVGDKVSHKTFGSGVVVGAQPMGNDTLLEISFDKAGVKKIMANFARLTKAD